MLEAINDTTKVEVLKLFKAFVQRTHGKDIAQWLSENWRSAEPYHFKLFGHLKSQNSQQIYDVLHFSLCVPVAQVPMFTEYATEFAKTPASRLLFEYLKATKDQPKLQFEDFTALCSVLMLEANASVIEQCKEQLVSEPLVDWI